MCKYENQCSSYNPKECHCEPELCYLYQMFLEEGLKHRRLYDMRRFRKKGKEFLRLSSS